MQIRKQVTHIIPLLSKATLMHKMTDPFARRHSRCGGKSTDPEGACLGSISGATLPVENVSAFLFGRSLLNEIFSGMPSH
jgi:hypothetical protein